MSTESDIQDRIRRAESEQMSLTEVGTWRGASQESSSAEQRNDEEVSDDPLVIQVYNEESDRIHMVVPAALRCSCEDHQYRDVLCKHLCALAQSDHSEPLHTALMQRHNEINDEIESLKDEREQVLAVVGETGVNQFRDEDEKIEVATDEEVGEIFGTVDSSNGGDWTWSTGSSDNPVGPDEALEILDSEDQQEEDELGGLVDDLTRGSGEGGE